MSLRSIWLSLALALLASQSVLALPTGTNNSNSATALLSVGSRVPVSVAPLYHYGRMVKLQSSGDLAKRQGSPQPKGHTNSDGDSDDAAEADTPQPEGVIVESDDPSLQRRQDSEVDLDTSQSKGGIIGLDY